MLLVFDDKNKEKLDKEDIKYIQIDSISDAFLEEMMGASIETSMMYEEIEMSIENVNKCYKFLSENCVEEARKISTKLQKFENEAFNIIYNSLKNNKEKILQTNLEETKED